MFATEGQALTMGQLMKCERVVLEICTQTGRQTDKETNTQTRSSYFAPLLPTSPTQSFGKSRVATPYGREWTRPLRVLLSVQCSLQTSPITQLWVRYTNIAVLHASYTLHCAVRISYPPILPYLADNRDVMQKNTSMYAESVLLTPVNHNQRVRLKIKERGYSFHQQRVRECHHESFHLTGCLEAIATPSNVADISFFVSFISCFISVVSSA